MFCLSIQSCVIPNLVKIGVQPFVQLSTCSGRKADSASSSLSIGHILLTAARENQSTCLNGTTGDYNHYTKITVVRVCVCESGRLLDTIRPQLKRFLFSA